MNMRTIILEILTIFSSFGTLVCCALPAALVSIGAGAALASIVTAVPQLSGFLNINFRYLHLPDSCWRYRAFRFIATANRLVPPILRRHDPVCDYGVGRHAFFVSPWCYTSSASFSRSCSLELSESPMLAPSRILHCRASDVRLTDR